MERDAADGNMDIILVGSDLCYSEGSQHGRAWVGAEGLILSPSRGFKDCRALFLPITAAADFTDWTSCSA